MWCFNRWPLTIIVLTMGMLAKGMDSSALKFSYRVVEKSGDGWLHLYWIFGMEWYGTGGVGE